MISNALPSVAKRKKKKTTMYGTIPVYHQKTSTKTEALKRRTMPQNCMQKIKNT
ncbi:MAG: hypothetical protein WCK02_14665 [Bacteroidota bacterium]